MLFHPTFSPICIARVPTNFTLPCIDMVDREFAVKSIFYLSAVLPKKVTSSIPYFYLSVEQPEIS